MKLKSLNILAFAICGMITGCVSEDPGNISHTVDKGYAFTADIVSYEISETRANRSTNDDLWSIKSFSVSQNDVAGFYSLTGNPDAPDANGPFNNIPMSYDGIKFINEDILYNTDVFVKASTFYYYPYHENMEYDASKTSYSPEEDYGIELRARDDRDQKDKFRDILYAINSTSATSASFHHCASSIVFLRDEGFKNAPDRTIKVVLNKGVSHAVAEDNKDYVKNIKFIYLDGYERNGVEMTEEDCKVWEAWDGLEDTPYVVNYPDSPYDGASYDNPQYILLPSTRSDSRLSVDHIEVYDDDGNLRVITNFTLYNQDSKTLYYGQRYPLILKMQDLEAQVVPINIKPWGEDKTIDDDRQVGIGNANDFDDWVLNYKAFLEAGRPNRDGSSEPLLAYGDKIISNGGVTWKFYINNDIDLSVSESVKEGLTSIFDNFDDTLEGNTHTLTGLNMSAASSPHFITTLGPNGNLRDLDILGFNISCTNPENASGGGLIGTCRGTVENCSFDGVIRDAGKVGILAVTGDNASVSCCRFSGILIGAESQSPFIFGEESGSEITGNSTSGIIFQQAN